MSRPVPVYRRGLAKPKQQVSKAIYYFGRFAQLVGMWILLVDIVTAGPRGPSPRLFAVGIGVFVIGWLLARTRKQN